MSKCLILSKNTYEAKLALLEDNKLEEIYIEREKEKEISGNIYKGKIEDILNKGEIIFVDIGLEKNAFLSFESKKNIPKFNISDSLIVQVETEARDEKGARLTLDYSINGENLVLLPNSKNLSISKKIEDLEIVKKLKDTFLNIDKGLILRTKSVEKSSEALLEEYKKLETCYDTIESLIQNVRQVLENPDKISRTVLEKGLDSGTAFEILSIDIADIDIGRNIGAELQADQAEADKKIAQAKAEERRAMAIAKEQEMKAEVVQMKSKVVEAESKVPLAIAKAFEEGKLGVMDYYNMKNVMADTQMRETIAGGEGKQQP